MKRNNLHSNLQFIPTDILLMSLPPIVNLLFMHYYFYFAKLLELTFLYSCFANSMSVVFDVYVLAFLLSWLCRGRIKCAFTITYFITLVWAFVNVFYSRFFDHYLPLSAVSSAGGLADSTTIAAMTDGFRLCDLFFLLSPVLFFYIYRSVKTTCINLRKCLKLLIPPILSLFLTIVLLSAYYFVQPRYRDSFHLYWIHVKGLLYDITCNAMPNLTHFQSGSIRVLLFETYNIVMPYTLTDGERLTIRQYVTPTEQRFSKHTKPAEIKNVIVILLESMLSHPIGLVENGREVMPFLNSLRADPTVYYNGCVISDIVGGESGDGQFIIMNGLLPLRYKATVSSVTSNTLLALPKQLERQMGISKSTVIIPTKPTMWQQNDMNVAYGIKQMFSLKDIQAAEQVSDINDAHIFNFAASKLDSEDKPFFHLILSLSTHSPYDKYVGENLFNGSTTYSQEYCNYLNTCHFLDEQLRHYFENLKLKGFYDQSLIVLVADHFAHINRLRAGEEVKPYTPLFIIGGNIDNSTAWQGECHQLDIYTTLIDVLNLGNTWYGLGHTLLLPNYVNSVDSHTFDISELIINGDYFAP